MLGRDLTCLKAGGSALYHSEATCTAKLKVGRSRKLYSLGEREGRKDVLDNQLHQNNMIHSFKRKKKILNKNCGVKKFEPWVHKWVPTHYFR